MFNIFKTRDKIKDFNNITRIEEWINLSADYINIGKLDKALICCNQGLKLYPSNSALLHNRGYVFRLKKKFREAITDYETSLKLRPLHIDTLYDKAFAHANLQEWDKADDCYDQILKIDYNHAGAIGDKGVIEASKGDYKESISYLDKALQIEPGNERVLKNRDYAFKKLKEQLIIP